MIYNVDSAESLHHVIIIKRVDSLQIHTTEFSHADDDDEDESRYL